MLELAAVAPPAHSVLYLAVLYLAVLHLAVLHLARLRGRPCARTACQKNRSRYLRLFHEILSHL